MKSYIILICIICLNVCLSFSQTNEDILKKGVGKVKIISGKEVYFCSEPMNPYTIVYEIESVLPIYAKRVKDSQFPIDYLLETAEDLHRSAKLSYSGVIVAYGSPIDYAIKFKNLEKNKQGLCIVNKVDDIYIFIFCKPISEYKIVFTIIQKQKEGTILIDKVLTKAKKQDKEFNQEYDAIIIGEDEEHFAIKFL